ncbi:hypothetical protein BDF19DRAFT_487405 [Syncephalis fuscata]|nr:hypothetical protein BDF19DRAFT_487405 [Syncephalis fuscata]
MDNNSEDKRSPDEQEEDSTLSSSSILSQAKNGFLNVNLEVPEPRVVNSQAVAEIENSAISHSSDSSQFDIISRASSEQSPSDKSSKHDNSIDNVPQVVHGQPEQTTRNVAIRTRQPTTDTGSLNEHTSARQSNTNISEISRSGSPPPAYMITSPQRQNGCGDSIGHTANIGTSMQHTDLNNVNSHASSPPAIPHRHSHIRKPDASVPAHAMNSNTGLEATMFPPPEYHYHLSPPKTTNRPYSPELPPPGYTPSPVYTSLPPGTYTVASHGRFTIVEDPVDEEALRDSRWRRQGDTVSISNNTTIPLVMVFWLFGWLFPLLWVFGLFWIRSKIPRERYWSYMCAINILTVILLAIIIAAINIV